MVKTVKYFKESGFGPVTLYTGRMASGLTLGAVIRMVRASKSKNPPTLVANCTLKGLDYEHINVEKFIERANEYLRGHYLILLDSGYSYFASRINLSRILTSFFQLLRKGDSKAILTTHSGLSVIDKGIRDQITDIVTVARLLPRKQMFQFTHHKKKPFSWVGLDEETGKWKRFTELRWTPISRCIVKRAGRYWRYYNTLEIIDIERVFSGRQ